MYFDLTLLNLYLSVMHVKRYSNLDRSVSKLKIRTRNFDKTLCLQNDLKYSSHFSFAKLHNLNSSVEDKIGVHPKIICTETLV